MTSPCLTRAAEPGENLRTHLYPDPAPGARPLRLLMLVPPNSPKWIASFLCLANESRRVKATVVTIQPGASGPSNEPPRAPWDVRAFVAAERRLMGLFLKFVRRKQGGPLSKVDLSGSANIPDESRGQAADLPTAQAIAERLDPDLIVLLGPAQWAAPLSGLATHGCWNIAADLFDEDSAALGLLGPILRNEPATPFALELVSSHREPVPLGNSWGATRAVSFSQQRELALLKLPAMLMRTLRGLADGGELTERGSVSTLRSAWGAERLTPGMGLKALGITLRLLAQSGLRKRKADQPWFVLIPQKQKPLDLAQPRIESHVTLVAPGRNYWADPFPLLDGEQKYLFVEEFLDGSCKGVISCLELQGTQAAKHHGIVLEEPFHLSYPQVFRWEGKWRMTVESCEADRVSVYETDAFPGGWKRVADLIQGRLCVDPTLHHHQGHWYLFGNVSESGGNPSDELFLFVADQLEGPYRAHPANPIVTDVRRARPAGRLFLDGERLIRPAQCCAPIYGSAVVFNEVLELTPETYIEKPVSRLDPSWSSSLDGCHTYNRDGDLEVLDAHGQVPEGASVIAIQHVHATSAGTSGLTRAAGKAGPMEFLLTATSWTWLL